MPVRNVSSIAFVKVTETIGGTNDGLTTTTTLVAADTDEKGLAAGKGWDCTVQLDFKISKHSITYSALGKANTTSSKETRTVRQHEYAHVGARNALASQTLLADLCKDVGVKWKFHIDETGNAVTDRSNIDKTKKTYEKAVEDYISAIVDYLDEKVVHETQRNAQLVGVKDVTQVAAMLAAISYSDPETGNAQAPNGKIMAKAVTETQTGSTKGENYAKGTSTPPSVMP
jgi:hypothetical protein